MFSQTVKVDGDIKNSDVKIELNQFGIVGERPHILDRLFLEFHKNGGDLKQWVSYCKLRAIAVAVAHYPTQAEAARRLGVGRCYFNTLKQKAIEVAK